MSTPPNYLYSFSCSLVKKPDIAETANDFSMFMDISVDSTSRPAKDELDAYLADPTEMTNTPLKWWWDKRHQYPILSQMAFDYLSVPGAYVSLCRFTHH